MIKSTIAVLFFLLFITCQPQSKYELDQEVMASLGNKYKTEYTQAFSDFRSQAETDSTDINALLGMARMNVLLRCYGYSTYNETVPTAQQAVKQALALDSLNDQATTMAGIISLLDWDWDNAEKFLKKSIQLNPNNTESRHWYSLYLVTMGRLDEAMIESDTMVALDTTGANNIGRGSLFYFEQRWDELVDLMLETVEMEPNVPWGYDWLGMAYNGLEQHDKAIETYLKSFKLSDGTVEVGGGLGHALGDAGEYELAKEMADYYNKAAEDHYLPPVQRAFIHISIEEYDEALTLLEQAYDEKSWFLAFIKSEHWYDPIRKEQRFQDIINRMNFPE